MRKEAPEKLYLRPREEGGFGLYDDETGELVAFGPSASYLSNIGLLTHGARGVVFDFDLALLDAPKGTR